MREIQKVPRTEAASQPKMLKQHVAWKSCPDRRSRLGPVWTGTDEEEGEEHLLAAHLGDLLLQPGAPQRQPHLRAPRYLLYILFFNLCNFLDERSD